MAEAGGGAFHYVEHETHLPAVLASEIGGLTELTGLAPRLEITLPLGARGHLLNAFPTSRAGKTIAVELRDLMDRDRIELVLMVTHHGRIWGDQASATGSLRSTDPATSVTRAVPLAIPRSRSASLHCARGRLQVGNP